MATFVDDKAKKERLDLDVEVFRVVFRLSAMLPPTEQTALRAILQGGRRENEEEMNALAQAYLDWKAAKNSLADPSNSSTLDTAWSTFKHQICRIVVHKLFSICSTIHARVFSQLSTETAKILVKGDLAQETGTNLKADRLELTYGDLDFQSVSCIMQILPPRQGDVFVDLGSGTGRVMITASLLHGATLGRIHGIEIVPALYNSSLEAIKSYQNLRKCEEYEGYFTDVKDCRITVQLGDVLKPGLGEAMMSSNTNENQSQPSMPATASESNIQDTFDWREADYVFANSTLFPADMMSELAKLAEDMKPGSVFVSCTNPLPSSSFKIDTSKTRNLVASWGTVTIYFQTRT